MSELGVRVTGELHRRRLARRPVGGLAASRRRLARIVCLGVIVACAGPAAASASASGVLYWTSPSTNAIMRAEAYGSTPQTLLKVEKPDSGIAVSGGYIYWSWAGGVGRANLDGSEPYPSFIKGSEGITGLAVASGHIYWAGPGGKIGRANLNGTEVEAEFIKGISGGSVIGLAANSEYIYWTNFWDSAIGRAKLNGSSVEQEYIQKTHTPMGLALNEQYLYWAITYENHIGRALLSGSEANVNFITTGLSSEGNEQVGVAVDAGHIYWANPTTGTIGRANINGAEIEPSFITGAGDPLGLTLVSPSLRVDPFVLEERLSYSATPDAGEAPAGVAISANGDTAVVGASQPAPGAVHVFQRGADGLWTLQQTISPGGSDGYFFGSHVALSEDGTTLLVTGESSSNLGHVWTYTLHEGVWVPDASTLEDPIKTNPPYDHDKPGFEYGNALAISGNGSLALVADEPQGAAVLYKRVGSEWEEVTSFSNGKSEPSEYGIAIALSGNGHDAIVAAPAAELVYSYSDSGGSWKQTGTFPYFAYDGQRNVSVAIDHEGDTAVSGEYLAGAARVWTEKPGSGVWDEQAKLTEPVGPTQEEFGSYVSLSASGTKALVLAFGFEEDELAYEYTRSPSSWNQQGTPINMPLELGSRGAGYIPEAALAAEGDTALLWSKFATLPSVYTDTPLVGIGVASELTTTAATLKGTVYPAEEKVTSCRFEFGTSLAYGSAKACSVTPEGSVTVPVSASVSGLSSGATYHFRLAVTTGAGTFDSSDATFTTFVASATGKTEEPSKPAKATLGSVSATASGGTGSVTVGSYGANVGEPPLPSSTGSYLDVYRSTSATFKEVEIKACEIGSAKALWAYGTGGWEPVSPAATLSEGCLTFTANASSRPSVAEMEGFKYKLGEPAGQFGECRARKDSVYSEGACLTVHESKGAPDGKGKYEWYPADPGICFPQKKGEFEEGACKAPDDQKGKPAGKYERTNGTFTSSAPSAVLEVGSEKIECAAGTGAGEFFSPEKGSETITLTGCAKKGTSCSSAGVAAGTVVSFPLEVIVLQSATGGAFELALAAAQFASFSCGNSSYAIEGATVGALTGDMNTMSTTTDASFTGAASQLIDLSGSTEIPVKLSMNLTTTSRQPLEVNTTEQPSPAVVRRRP